MAAIVFWVALSACAIKGPTVVFVVLSVLLFTWITLESASRGGDEEERVWEDNDTNCERAMCCCFCTLFCTPTNALCGIMPDSIKGTICHSIYHLALVGTMVLIFLTASHVPNNYAAYPNMTAPEGLPGQAFEENYFDCHQRTSGIYPGTLAICMSVVFSILALLMEPKYGNRHFMGMSYEERRERNFLLATEGMSEQEKNISMILAIWRWADINGDLVLSALDGERWIKNTAIDSDGDYSDGERYFKDYVEMCDTMGVGLSPFDVDPREIDFGPHPVETRSEFRTIQVKAIQNVGNLQVDVRSIDPESFEVTPRQVTISTDGVATARVRFRPRRTGESISTVTFSTPGVTLPVVVRGSGVGFWIGPITIGRMPRSSM